MGSELWEIVRADQVKAGDVVSAYPVHFEMEVTEEILGTWRFEDEDDYMYRRVDPADDPRVLRRALELLITSGGDRLPYDSERQIIEQYIDQARRELESEGRDA